jgi:hypothetical protein
MVHGCSFAASKRLHSSWKGGGGSINGGGGGGGGGGDDDDGDDDDHTPSTPCGVSASSDSLDGSSEFPGQPFLTCKLASRAARTSTGTRGTAALFSLNGGKLTTTTSKLGITPTYMHTALHGAEHTRGAAPPAGNALSVGADGGVGVGGAVCIRVKLRVLS